MPDNNRIVQDVPMIDERNAMAEAGFDALEDPVST